MIRDGACDDFTGQGRCPRHGARPVTAARTLAAWALVLVMAAAPLRADAGGGMADLGRALGLRDTVEIMRAEGLRHGDMLARDMLDGADSRLWQTDVARIHDPARMYDLVMQRFTVAMAGVDPAPALAFFGSAGGQRIVRLELAARRLLLDPGAEAAAERRLVGMQAEGAPILDHVDGMIADSDLLERNVTGAMNANLMFYRGLGDGGGLQMTEAEILADVRAQAPRLRDDSRAWLRAFLSTAHQPLPDGLLADYAAFYRTPAGRALNRALFAAFDGMYGEISYLLGRAVAFHMQGQSL